MREFRWTAGSLWRPLKEVLEKREETRARCERAAGRFDVSFEFDNFPLQLTVLAKAECIAIGVEDVGKPGQPLPLRLVMRVLELARVVNLPDRSCPSSCGDGILGATILRTPLVVTQRGAE